MNGDGIYAIKKGPHQNEGGIDLIYLFGSQAIHASVNFEFPEAQRSIEVDISAFEDKDLNG